MNTRHHNIRSLIATALRERDFTVYEEVHRVSLEGSYHRIDMIAIPASSTEGYIIDPTIRTECYEDQPRDVHEEKCNFYVPTIPFYKDKYNLTSIEQEREEEQDGEIGDKRSNTDHLPL
ncbi:hypothetical protein C0J52_04806 [Blattella germanica]|nr:hypothetical protein C0J52_04806 [Blattella germanica]